MDLAAAVFEPQVTLVGTHICLNHCLQIFYRRPDLADLEITKVGNGWFEVRSKIDGRVFTIWDTVQIPHRIGCGFNALSFDIMPLLLKTEFPITKQPVEEAA